MGRWNVLFAIAYQGDYCDYKLCCTDKDTDEVHVDLPFFVGKASGSRNFEFHCLSGMETTCRRGNPPQLSFFWWNTAPNPLLASEKRITLRDQFLAQADILARLGRQGQEGQQSRLNAPLRSVMLRDLESKRKRAWQDEDGLE